MTSRAPAVLSLGLVCGVLVAVTAATPHPPGVRIPAIATLFETSDRCLACHNGVTTSSGEDVSIGYDWRASMMANSARDPYWHASVRRELMDFPAESEAIQDECAKCHMPMARATAAADGRKGSVFAHLPAGDSDDDESRLAVDGVSCALCHRIAPEGLGDQVTESGNFRIAAEVGGQRHLFGPFQTDSGRRRVMQSATNFVPTESRHVQASEMCASCHTLRTHALGAGRGASLPEQTPYLEWRASSFARTKTCQACHMPEVPEEVAVTGVLGQPRPNVSRHVFQGGNFFMLGMLARNRHELGVVALPQELDLAVARTIAHLQSSTARVEIENAGVQGSRLAADVIVRNLAGHKFPTAYPSRRAWLHVTVRDAAGGIVFESGAFSRDGSIAGNDNDRDGATFEPHYQMVERDDQVQVYESVMRDPQGRPTTGLLTAVGYAKDNRLLPDGFDRAAGGPDIAVHGAEQDPDFAGGQDRVRYSISTAGRQGPFAIDVELWFQPIAFRWARNLAAYDAPETRRFVAWYDAMAASSAIVVARSMLSSVR